MNRQEEILQLIKQVKYTDPEYSVLQEECGKIGHIDNGGPFMAICKYCWFSDDHYACN